MRTKGDAAGIASISATLLLVNTERSHAVGLKLHLYSFEATLFAKLYVCFYGGTTLAAFNQATFRKFIDGFTTFYKTLSFLAI